MEDSPTYNLPIQLLRQSRAPLKIAEFIFWRSSGAGRVEFLMNDLYQATGVSKKILGTGLKEFEKRGILEDIRPPEQIPTRWNPETNIVLPIGGPLYLYNIRNYNNLLTNSITKPSGFVTNGWLALVQGSLAIKILNHIYDQDGLSNLGLQILRRSTLRTSKGNFPRKSEVQSAVSHLVELELIHRLGPEGIGIRDTAYTPNIVRLASKPTTLLHA